MYAIVKVGNAQYKIAKGDQIDVALSLQKKKEVTLDEVLLAHSGKEVIVGKPYIKDAKVVCDVVSEVKGEKVISFKYKKRKRYKIKKGFRAQLVRLKVKEIKVG